jgi:hypothetical protein
LQMHQTRWILLSFLGRKKKRNHRHKSLRSCNDLLAFLPFSFTIAFLGHFCFITIQLDQFWTAIFSNTGPTFSANWSWPRWIPEFSYIFVSKNDSDLWFRLILGSVGSGGD